MEKGFLIFQNYISYFKYLKGDEVKELMIALCEYSATKEKPANLSIRVDCYFEVIRQQIDINTEKYKDTCNKRSEAGKIGNQIRWNKKSIDNQKENRKNRKCDKVSQNIANANKPSQSVANARLINININKNININNKKENNIKEKSLAVAKATAPTNEQQEVFNYFAKLYKQETNIDYLGKGIDYINLAKLIKKYGKALVIQKVNWLLVGCKHNVFWFSKDINDFNISTLMAHWDRILPKLTEEQKKEQEKARKEYEKRQKVIKDLAKQGIVFEEDVKQRGLVC